MGRVYVDISEIGQGCAGAVGVIMSDAQGRPCETVYCGVSVYSMPVSDRCRAYELLRDCGGIDFLFDDMPARPDFYAVPALHAFARGGGGWFCSAESNIDISSEHAPVYFVDGARRCVRVADSLRGLAAAAVYNSGTLACAGVPAPTRGFTDGERAYMANLLRLRAADAEYPDARPAAEVEIYCDRAEAARAHCIVDVAKLAGGVSMKPDMDRARGALYGVAAGDALGATVEFMDAGDIARRYGTLRDIVGGGWLHLEPGRVTDDTDMTLAMAEGMRARPDAPEQEVGRRFIAWADTAPKDIGATCAIAIDYARGHGWKGAALHAHNALSGKSAGNGSLMRTVYTGLFYSQRAHALDVAGRLSRLTHYDPLAGEACRLYTAMIWDMVRGGVPEREAIASALSGTRYDAARLSGDAQPKPTGFVVDSFECALHAVLSTDSAEDAIVMAVNMGGDADTVGAIAGGLAGAMYGYAALPARWIHALNADVKARLDAVLDF